MLAAQIILVVFCVYAAVGLLFAAVFVTSGAARLDPSALRAPIGFRIMIFPGSALFWPLLSVKWVRAARTTMQEQHP